ncbi:unnamed protein product, partial [Urochloa humidicola]
SPRLPRLSLLIHPRPTSLPLSPGSLHHPPPLALRHCSHGRPVSSLCLPLLPPPRAPHSISPRSLARSRRAWWAPVAAAADGSSCGGWTAARGGGSTWGGDAAVHGPATTADAVGRAWDPASSGDGLRRWAQMRGRRLGDAQPSRPHSGVAPVPFPILQGLRASGAARPAGLWSETPLVWPSRRK